MNLDDQILNVLRRLETLQDRTTQIGVELLHLRNAVSRLRADSKPQRPDQPALDRILFDPKGPNTGG